MSGRAYHHGNLREDLVDAAVSAVRERGADGLALRELARQVGVSHNAAYRHFVNRDDLLSEVAARVMRQLVEMMEQRLAAVDTVDPVLRARRRLAETGRAYVDFALAEPGLFRLAFSSASALTESDPYLLLSQVLDELVEVGFLSTEARIGAEVTCWAGMHGFSVLAMDGAVRAESAAERDASLERVLVAIDRSFAATTGVAVTGGELRPQPAPTT